MRATTIKRKLYFRKVLHLNNVSISQKKISALMATFSNHHHFTRKSPDTAKQQAALEEQANRLRLELIDAYTKMGLGVHEWELLQKLKNLGKVRCTRNTEVRNHNVKFYEKELLEAGLKKDYINKIINPALKRFIKKEQNDPFNIGYFLPTEHCHW